MVSNKGYLNFVLEQCEGLTARAMMGEFVLYYGGKVVGGVYDNRLLVKPTPLGEKDDAECPDGASLRGRKGDASCGEYGRQSFFTKSVCNHCGRTARFEEKEIGANSATSSIGRARW